MQQEMLFCKFLPCNAGQQSVKRKCRSNAYKCEKNPVIRGLGKGGRVGGRRG